VVALKLNAGIWGFHDRRLTLRKALCSMLIEGNAKDAFRRRWRYHQSQINKQVHIDFISQAAIWSLLLCVWMALTD